MKFSQGLVILLVVLSACTTKNTNKAAAGDRQVASLSDGYNRNVQILNSIPLVPGVESQESSEPDEAATLIGIFNKIENEARNQDSSLNRGTHAKGHCFEGHFTIFTAAELRDQYHYSDTLIQRLQRGFFAKAGDHKASVRFANAMGSRNPDTTADVRALSFSVDHQNAVRDFSNSGRQDFMMNSSPMFAVNNIHEFLELMKAARLAGGDFDYFPNPFYLPAVLNAKKLLDQYNRADVKSYATEEYWDNLPYTHGVNGNGTPMDLVKFKTTPCDGKGLRKESSKGKAENYLGEDILKRANEGKICFLFQVQFFDAEVIRNTLDRKHSDWSVTDWVENGGELWDESALPFYNLAKVEVRPEPTADGQNMVTEVRCEDEFINTRLHSSPMNQPIGSIARVRTYVEENSRARRMKELQ